MTETLAQLVRKKHPGAYDDLSDAALEAKVDAKFPGAYADMPRSTKAQPAEPSPSKWSGESYAAPARGVAKGLYNTFAGATRLAAPVAAKVGVGGQFPPLRDAPVETGEEAGATVGQMLPYLTPGGPTRGLAGMAVQGLKAGGIAAAQGQDPIVAGAIGAAGPLTAKVGEMIAPALRKLAETQYGRALNATTRPLKAESRKIVPELLNRGVTGSLESLAEAGTVGSAEAGKAISGAYAEVTRAGVKANTGAILKSLDNIKQRFYVVGQGGKAVNANPGAVAKVEELENLIGQMGPKADPDQLWKLRKSLDDIISAGGGFAGQLTPGTTKALQRETRMVIQKELNKAAPNMEKLNAEFSLWKGLEKVARATMERQTGQSKIVDTGIRTVIGGTGGLLLGDEDPKWAAAGVLLATLTKSPRYRTMSAVNKAALAHALSQGTATPAITLLSRLTAGLGSSGSREQSKGDQ